MSQPPDFGGVNAGFASLVDTARLGKRDAFELALAPQVGMIRIPWNG
jgi:hypothetical protein